MTSCENRQYHCHHRHIRLVDTDLYNLVTKKAVCEKTKKDLVEQIELGQKLFSSFVERVKSGN